MPWAGRANRAGSGVRCSGRPACAAGTRTGAPPSASRKGAARAGGGVRPGTTRRAVRPRRGHDLRTPSRGARAGQRRLRPRRLPPRPEAALPPWSATAFSRVWRARVSCGLPSRRGASPQATVRGLGERSQAAEASGQPLAGFAGGADGYAEAKGPQRQWGRRSGSRGQGFRGARRLRAGRPDRFPVPRAEAPSSATQKCPRQSRGPPRRPRPPANGTPGWARRSPWSGASRAKARPRPGAAQYR